MKTEEKRAALIKLILSLTEEEINDILKELSKQSDNHFAGYTNV